jgi:hypothetical protein
VTTTEGLLFRVKWMQRSVKGFVVAHFRERFLRSSGVATIGRVQREVFGFRDEEQLTADRSESKLLQKLESMSLMA